MTLCSKLVSASRKVLMQYETMIELEIKRKQNLLKEFEYEIAVEKLKDLIINEDLELERLRLELQKFSFDEILMNFLPLFESLEEDVKERIINKLKDSIFNFENFMLQLKENNQFPKEMMSNPVFHEIFMKEMDELTNSLQSDFFIVDKPEFELDKAYYFFMQKEIEDETDFDSFSFMICDNFMEVYNNPKLETELLKYNFHPDYSWISVTDLLGVDDSTATMYVSKLSEQATFRIENVIDVALEDKWEESMYPLVDQAVARAFLRSSMYLLIDEAFEQIVKTDFSKEEEFKSRPATLSLITNATLKALEDRKKYPKIDTKNVNIMNNEFICASAQIKEYYNLLSELEIRKFNGEDIDLEFQKLIDIIKKARAEEDRNYLEAILKYACFNLLTEDVEIKVGWATSDSTISNRVRSKFDEVLKQPDLKLKISKKLGISPSVIGHSKDSVLERINYDIEKNICFFYNEMIISSPDLIRETLIKKKYERIYSNTYLESEILESNFQMTNYDLMVSATFGMDFLETIEYFEHLKKYVIFSIEDILENVEVIDWKNEENKEGIFTAIVTEIRGLLYSLDDNGYGEFKTTIDEMLKERAFGDNYMQDMILKTALMQSMQDREKYLKLIL